MRSTQAVNELTKLHRLHGTPRAVLVLLQVGVAAFSVVQRPLPPDLLRGETLNMLLLLWHLRPTQTSSELQPRVLCRVLG